MSAMSPSVRWAPAPLPPAAEHLVFLARGAAHSCPGSLLPRRTEPLRHEPGRELVAGLGACWACFGRTSSEAGGSPQKDSEFWMRT